MDPASAAMSAAKGVAAGAKVAQAALTTAASLHTGNSGILREYGNGARLATAIEGAAQGAKYTIKDTPKLRKVITLFQQIFAGHQVLNDMAFTAQTDSTQGKVSAYLLGTRFVNTTAAREIQFKQPSSRQDLAMYLVFCDFQDKCDYNSKIETYDEMLFLIIPLIFQHYSVISDYAAHERRQYKREGLRRLSTFIAQCRTEVVGTSSGTSKNLHRLILALDFSQNVTVAVAREVEVSLHLRDRVETTANQLGIVASWLKYLCLTTISVAPVPPTYSQDMSIKASAPKFDIDAVLRSLLISDDLAKATKLKALSSQDERSRWFLWSLLRYEILKKYTDDYKIATETVYGLTTNGGRPPSYRPADSESNEDRKKNAQQLRAQALQNILDTLRTNIPVHPFHVEKINSASPDVKAHLTQVVIVMQQLLLLHDRAEVLEQAAQRLRAVCMEHGEHTRYLESLYVFIDLWREFRRDCAPLVADVEKLHQQEIIGGNQYFLKVKKQLSLEKLTVSHNTKVLHKCFGNHGLINSLESIDASLNGIRRESDLIQPQSLCDKMLRLVLLIYDRINEGSSRLYADRADAKLQDMIEAILRQTIPGHIVTAALQVAHAMPVAEPGAGALAGGADGEPVAMSVSDSAARQMSAGLAVLFAANQAKERRLNQQLADRAPFEHLKRAGNAAFVNYVAHVGSVSIWGRHLTGSHTSVHVAAAQAKVNLLSDICDNAHTSTSSKLAQIRAEIMATSAVAHQGPFGRFKGPTRVSFEKLLQAEIDQNADLRQFWQADEAPALAESNRVYL